MNLVDNVVSPFPSHWLWEIGVDEHPRTRTRTYLFTLPYED